MLGLLLFFGVLGLLLAGLVWAVYSWWAGLALALVSILPPLVVWLLRYRPPEGSWAAVARRGYFQRWVPSGQYTLRLPLLEKVLVELDLGPRLVRRRYQQVLSRDRVPLVIEVRVRFTVHPEGIEAHLRPHLLRLEPAGWLEEVARPLGELLHNEVGLRFSAAELLSPHGRQAACAQLARRLRESLRPTGIEIDQQEGVAFAYVLPNAALLRALEQRSAANGAPQAGPQPPAPGSQSGRTRRAWPTASGRR